MLDLATNAFTRINYSALKSALCGLLVVFLSGCLASKSYVDPAFSSVSYADITQVESKYAISLDVLYRKNGEPAESGNSHATNLVAGTLLSTGIFNITGQPADSSIHVIVDNVAKQATAAAKGFGTVLTLGAVGSTVVDSYIFSIKFTAATGRERAFNYEHRLYTTVGNKKPPFRNAMATSSAEGFVTIVEQVLLTFVSELQNKGLLSGPPEN